MTRQDQIAEAVTVSIEIDSAKLPPNMSVGEFRGRLLTQINQAAEEYAKLLQEPK